MKTRIVYTKMWKDPWFAGLNPTEKLLFIYYLTNERVNIIHCYELSEREVIFDTGLDRTTLEKANEKFVDAGKLGFYKDWVFLVNAHRYETYKGSSNEKAKRKTYENMPSDVLDWYKGIKDRGVGRGVDWGVGRGVDRGVYSESTVPEIRNQKSEIRNHKTKTKSKRQKIEISNKSDESNRGNKSNRYNQGNKNININKGDGEDEKNPKEITEKLVRYYNRLFCREVRVTDKKVKKVRNRLKIFTPKELARVIHKCSQKPFYRGENDREWVATMEYMFRNNDKTDDLLNLKVERKKYKTPDGRVFYDKTKWRKYLEENYPDAEIVES